MQQTEMIGIVVIGLAAILGLFALISKPFSNLTTAINELKVVLSSLSTSLENTDKLVQKLDQRMSKAEKKIQGIELNCAKTGHLSDREDDYLQ